jgi:hypothetical protein
VEVIGGEYEASLTAVEGDITELLAELTGENLLVYAS